MADKQKELLDRQTAYLTFLPHMDDGFHTGYQTTPGVVSDHSRRPREWLESLARNMKTQGRDVGYSIPDVLAGEQQLRRLARLKPEEARRHQQMIDYRALLALLLLWDTWEQDDNWPRLELHQLDGEGTGFSASVSAALSPARAPEGLHVFTLRSAADTQGDERPVALLSRAMVLVPAAAPGDLALLLPAQVTWYDRSARRFLDPCEHLGALDRFRLLTRLRVLQKLCDEDRWFSPLRESDPQLGSMLERFALDLLTVQKSSLDPDALRLRILAAYTFAQTGALPVEARTVRASDCAIDSNPLLRVYLPAEVPPCSADSFTCYELDGMPFACQDPHTLLAPVSIRGEEETVARLRRELALLERHDARWRRAAAQMLHTLHNETAGRTGLDARIPSLLKRWASDLERLPAEASRELMVDHPLSDCPAALRALLGEMIGMDDPKLICGVFSDVLLLFTGEQPSDCAKPVSGFDTPHWAAAPLSGPMCRWLMDHSDADGLYAPYLDSWTVEKQNGQLCVSLRVMRRSRELGAAPVSSVTFRRSYVLSAAAAAGAAVVQDHRPGVVVWPNVRFAPDAWKQYFVFTHQPGDLSIFAPDTDGWAQGELCKSDENIWHTASVSRFPAYVLLKRGELTLGALINDQSRRVLKHEPAAAAAIDFGSISTTVMLRQGDRVQPAVLPECVHGTILRGSVVPALAEAFLPDDVLLPDQKNPSTYYSLMDMFSDQSDRWTNVLRDGHIYYRTTLEALAHKNAGALYYDLKWSDERYAQQVMRLFLKQAMLQGALCARLWGSSSISWRVSMPNVMPLHKQESYLELMRGLARELASETGLPLTPGVPPVLYATENQADGLYFLSRSEINARSGYLNLDIGGSTADLSLWLDVSRRATIECSLLMGCRQMLFDSLLERHLFDFESDFASDTLHDPIRSLAHVWRTEGTTVRGRRKCMLLLDDLFASRAEELRTAMAHCRSNGRISYLESLLLFHVGFLFYLAGELVQRAWQDERFTDLLPEKMELCIAGNGGQLLKAFDEEQRTRLCSMTLARLDKDHPLQVLLPVQSSHPKQEVARGLLFDDEQLESALSGSSRFNGTRDGENSSNLVLSYLPLFYHVFPQAGRRLMPLIFEDDGTPALRGTAAIELETIYMNSCAILPNDDIARYVYCLDSLKRLWLI